MDDGSYANSFANMHKKVEVIFELIKSRARAMGISDEIIDNEFEARIKTLERQFAEIKADINQEEIENRESVKTVERLEFERSPFDYDFISPEIDEEAMEVLANAPTPNLDGDFTAPSEIDEETMDALANAPIPDLDGNFTAPSEIDEETMDALASALTPDLDGDFTAPSEIDEETMDALANAPIPDLDGNFIAHSEIDEVTMDEIVQEKAISSPIEEAINEGLIERVNSPREITFYTIKNYFKENGQTSMSEQTILEYFTRDDGTFDSEKLDDICNPFSETTWQSLGLIVQEREVDGVIQRMVYTEMDRQHSLHARPKAKSKEQCDGEIGDI